MIALLAPLGLLALAALALPILIHLRRQAEEQKITFAALRWLSETTHASKRLRLHERVLLALRLLLLAVLALLLALPAWRDRAEPGTPWVAVAPGVDAAQARAAVDAPAAEWHWLAPGFPPLDDAPPVTTAPVSSLVRELDAQLSPATALTLVVPRELGALDAERPALRRAVDWRVVDGRAPGAAGPTTTPTIDVAVRFDRDGADELRVVRALARAWEADGAGVSLDVAEGNVAVGADADWLFWLGGDVPASVEAWVEEGGVALVTHSDAAGGEVLIDDEGNAALRERALGRGRLLVAAGALTPEATPVLLAPDFPRRLRELMSAPAPAPDRAAAEAVTPRHVAAVLRGPPIPLDRGLALAAALLFLAERLWATRRRESPR